MAPAPASDKLLLLYDGVCGLCNRLNQFVLRRDHRDRFRFAALQSELAINTLARHGRDPRELNTVYLVLDWGTPSEHVVSKALAILHVLRELGGVWRCLAVARVLPLWLLDLGYDLVARNRYRWFGKFESCLMPRPEHQEKFLD